MDQAGPRRRIRGPASTPSARPGSGTLGPSLHNQGWNAMDRRILVVDDSELICEQLSQLLARPDRRIKVAHDGTTALEWLIERNFSVVLTDLCLPGADGLARPRTRRRRPRRPPGTAMPGHAPPDSAAQARNPAATAF